MGRRTTVATGLMGVFLLAATATAVPRMGGRLPVFEVTDLAGTSHDTRELSGRRTLVVAITQRGGSDMMAAWGRAADGRIASSVHRVWMVLLDLAFFVPTATARSIARDQTPRGSWEDTWLDVHHNLAEAAELPGSPVPWAFALDDTGTIVAAFHGAPNEPGANAIWWALRPTDPPW